MTSIARSRSGIVRGLFRPASRLWCHQASREISTLRPAHVLRSGGVLPSVYTTRRNNSSATAAANAVSETASVVADPATLQTVADAVTVSSSQVGYFESIGLAQTWMWPTDIAEHLLEITHVYTGLPWWATIVLVGAGSRLAFLPLTFKGHVMNMKMKKIKPQMDLLSKASKEAPDAAKRTQYALRSRKLMKMHGIKMSVMAGSGVAQIPIAYGMFVAVVNMGKVPVDGFTTGGALWFQDLTAVDPYLGLSFISAITAFTTMKFTDMATVSPMVKNLMTYGASAAMLLMGMWYSAASALYLISTGTVAFATSMFMKTRAFRKLMKIPEADFVQASAAPNSAASNSYKDIWENAKKEAQNRTKPKEVAPVAAPILPVRLKPVSRKNAKSS